MKTIVVENLDPDVTRDDLQSLFESYGEISGIDVVAGQNFGYVRMSDDSEAYRAMRALNGSQCCGRTITVMMAHAYSARKREISNLKETEALALAMK